MKTAPIATIDGAAQDLPIVKSSLKVLVLVLYKDGATTGRHDMLIVIFSAVILFIRIVQVEGFLLVGAGAGDSAAHGRPASKVDKLLRAADARGPSGGLHFLQEEYVLLETLLPRVIFMAPRTSRLRVQIVIADISAATFDLRNALAAEGHDIAGHNLLIVSTTDKCSCLRANKHVSTILLVVGGEESQLVRCGPAPL